MTASAFDSGHMEHGNNSSHMTHHDQHVRIYEQAQLDARIAELRSLPPLLGDFVSLDEVVEQVGLGVELPDDLVASYLPPINIRPSLEEQPFPRMLREYPVRTALQQAQAAFLLLDHLFNDRGVRRPRWVELSSYGGTPVMNEAVAMEGRKELENIGGATRNYLSGLRRVGDFSDRRWGKRNGDADESSLAGLGTSTDGGTNFQVAAHSQKQNPLIRSIGFYRSEVVRYLDAVRVRHQIRLRNVDVEATSSPESDSELKVRRTKQRRDLLEPAIDQAINDANGSTETPEVWLKLKQLALNEFPPFKGTFSEKGDIEYDDDDPSSGGSCIKSFSRDALDSRLRRRKKGAASGK